MKETELILEKDGVDLLPPQSSQNCVQTLEPLVPPSLFRTVNGELISLNAGAQKKYKSTIACQDQCAAALEGIWPGERVRVGCLQWLSQPVSQGEQTARLRKDAVGSLCLLKYQDSSISLPVDKNTVVLPNSQKGGFIWYRPYLDMMVTQYRIKHNEWGTVVGWSLDLEEI